MEVILPVYAFPSYFTTLVHHYWSFWSGTTVNKTEDGQNLTPVVHVYTLKWFHVMTFSHPNWVLWPSIVCTPSPFLIVPESIVDWFGPASKVSFAVPKHRYFGLSMHSLAVLSPRPFDCGRKSHNLRCAFTKYIYLLIGWQESHWFATDWRLFDRTNMKDFCGHVDPPQKKKHPRNQRWLIFGLTVF